MGLTEKELHDLIEYRLHKSQDVFKEAIDVANLHHWNLTVNRLYYSIFHACNALLLSRGHSAKTHNGIMKLIMLHFTKPGILSKQEGALISTLFNMRNTGDYDDLFDWNEKQVQPLIDPTRQLLCKITSLIHA